ncbi:MAG: Phosphoesterase PA-phosphatase related protein, partial [candidate division CPR3 bacterium GW2011_GWE2_35_7]
RIKKEIQEFYKFLRFSHHALLILVEIISGALLSLLMLMIFAVITEKVLYEQVLFIDVNFAEFIYSLRTPFLTILMNVITYFGSSVVIFITTVFIILVSFRKHRKEAIFFIFTLFMGITINFFLKLIFQIPRPNIAPLIVENTYSYPSGHAMNSLVLYGTVSYLTYRYFHNKKLEAIVITVSMVLVFLIGFSRIYLGVHYLSDVVAGYIAGFFWLLMCILIERSIRFLRLFIKFEE